MITLRTLHETFLNFTIVWHTWTGYLDVDKNWFPLFNCHSAIFFTHPLQNVSNATCFHFDVSASQIYKYTKS